MSSSLIFIINLENMDFGIFKNLVKIENSLFLTIYAKFELNEEE
jgi:hypothetical protein